MVQKGHYGFWWSFVSVKDGLSFNIEAFRDFDRSAIARALNLMEDRRPDWRARAISLMDDVSKLPPIARVVGLTGPPGVGKSSIISRLIEQYRSTDYRIGIVAVDPSSQDSGGALLGDRSRMELPVDAPVYVRSYAARDRLGGLSRDAFAAVFFLRHCCDLLFIETVGVGQSELDVTVLADTTVLVLQPLAGDMLQFLKSGVMDIPDVLVVNKADNEGLVQTALSELAGALTLKQHDPAEWVCPLLPVSALTNENIDTVTRALEAHHQYLLSSTVLDSTRIERQVAWAVRELVYEIGARGLEKLGGAGAVESLWRRQPKHWSELRRLEALVARNT